MRANQTFTPIFRLILAASLACGIVAPQTSAADEKQPRAHKKFEPPPVSAPPEPVLYPPPDIPDLAFGSPIGEPSVAQQSQSLLGRTLEALPPPPVSSVIRAIIGFVALMVLSYLGGARRVKAVERQWNIAHLITTGLPFVLLGLIAASPQIQILTPRVLTDVAPLLPLGLGWIGFVVGSRFQARSLDQLPNATGTIVLVMAAIPVLLMTVPLALTISTVRARPIEWGLLRDAILLATAGTIAARSAPGFLRALLPNQQVSDRLMRTVELEQLAGVVGLMMIGAFYRPDGDLVAWHLPGTAWLFVTVGIGTTMGVVLYTSLNQIKQGPQFTVVLLGFVAFTAGMASFLRISPLTTCFIAGAIAVNLGPQWQEQIRETFERIERPVYFLFMVIAGALWHPWEWQGWVLMMVFVSSRFVSKWIASGVLKRWLVPDLTADEGRALTSAPMGALSVAIVVTAQDLYSGPTVTWIVTAVIGGALVTEVVLQVVRRRVRGHRTAIATNDTPEAVPEVD